MTIYAPRVLAALLRQRAETAPSANLAETLLLSAETIERLEAANLNLAAAMNRRLREEREKGGED
jgi:hypothetical protein